jgi:peptidoglycan/LPS O-acetylase OafA/YrhL
MNVSPAGVGKLPLNKIGRIEALDSVRGIAAFIVVIHHCFLTRPVYSDFFFSHWKTPATGLVSWIFLYTPARLAWAGYEAVTLFYVLSGLVLALPWVEERPLEYKKFAIRRMCRLYIPYAAAILAAGVLNVGLLRHAYVSGASQWVNTMTWTNPVTPLLILDHLAVIGHHPTIDGVTHTLIWEIRVSLLFPLIIVPIIRWGVRGALAVLAFLVALIVGLQLLYGDISAVGDLLAMWRHQSIANKLAVELQWTAYYACFFVFGSLLAARIREIRLLFSRAGSWLGFVLLGSGLLVFQGHWSQWHAAQEFMVAVGSVLILGAALAPGSVEKMLLKRFPRYLGKLSFSLYLVHVPVILTLTILTHGKLSLPLLILIVVPVSIGLAEVFDRMVTAPSAKLGHRLTQAKRDSRLAPAPQPVLREGRI